MTRKRYIKLFMALGVSRNAANRMADRCRAAGIPYAMNYSARSPWLKLGKAARMASVALLNLGGAARAVLHGIADGTARALHQLEVHHAQPITPGNLEGGNMIIVTRQEHERLHGYSANVTFVDENHQTQRHDDALDALSYAALIAGRGNGRSDMALTERDFVEITPTEPPAEFSTRYMGRWEISAEGGDGSE